MTNVAYLCKPYAAWGLFVYPIKLLTFAIKRKKILITVAQKGGREGGVWGYGTIPIKVDKATESRLTLVSKYK